VSAAARREQRLHRFFEITLLLKAAFAAGEIVAAIGVYVVPLSAVSRFVGAVTHAEMMRHAPASVAAHLADWAQSLSVSTKDFVAFYLLSHGAVKLWVIAGLLRERLWYYPLALVIFAAFILYQLHRYTLTHSVSLLLITVIDLVVIALTWHEYRYLRGHRSVRSGSQAGHDAAPASQSSISRRAIESRRGSRKLSSSACDSSQPRSNQRASSSSP
jgi:uncharacterized membrane protein